MKLYRLERARTRRRRFRIFVLLLVLGVLMYVDYNRRVEASHGVTFISAEDILKENYINNGEDYIITEIDRHIRNGEYHVFTEAK